MKQNLSKKLFDFRMNDPKIVALVDKYEQRPEDYPEDDVTPKLQAIYKGLNQWERIVMYAYAENHSVRKLAAFFEVKPYYTRMAITNITKKIKDNLRRTQRKEEDITWL